MFTSSSFLVLSFSHGRPSLFSEHMVEYKRIRMRSLDIKLLNRFFISKFIDAAIAYPLSRLMCKFFRSIVLCPTNAYMQLLYLNNLINYLLNLVLLIPESKYILSNFPAFYFEKLRKTKYQDINEPPLHSIIF